MGPQQRTPGVVGGALGLSQPGRGEMHAGGHRVARGAAGRGCPSPARPSAPGRAARRVEKTKVAASRAGPLPPQEAGLPRVTWDEGMTAPLGASPTHEDDAELSLASAKDGLPDATDGRPSRTRAWALGRTAGGHCFPAPLTRGTENPAWLRPLWADRKPDCGQTRAGSPLPTAAPPCPRGAHSAPISWLKKQRFREHAGGRARAAPRLSEPGARVISEGNEIRQALRLVPQRKSPRATRSTRGDEHRGVYGAPGPAAPSSAPPPHPAPLPGKETPLAQAAS